MAGRVRYLVKRGDSYWARVVVPVKLRPVIGKNELREPLGSNRKIAEKNLHGAVARFHEILKKAEEGHRTSHKPLSLSELAHAHHAEELALEERVRTAKDEHGKPLFDRAPELFRDGYIKALRKVTAGHASDEEAGAVIGWAIQKFQTRNNISTRIGTDEWRKLASVLAGVQIDAIERTREAEQMGVADEPKHPLLKKPPQPRTEDITLTSLFNGYIRELKASGKGGEAEKRWKSVITDLKRFLKHEEARRITKADLVRWKDAKLETLSAKTVRDVHMGAIKAIFQWAADNGRLEANPAQGIKVRVGKRVTTREKGFNDAEALAVLKAAKNYKPTKRSNPRTSESETLTAAKRWTPWLCAYTGARIAEMTQLRKEDVQERNGIHYLRITPEAGSVKSGKHRDVPLHPHLIEMGFLEFVASCADGPLFFSGPPTPGKQHPSKTVAGRVGNWIRSLNIIDPSIAPNHGWRHRFKTVGIEVGMHGRTLDAIQGHAPRTAGDDYGDVTLTARHKAIWMHPRYNVK